MGKKWTILRKRIGVLRFGKYHHFKNHVSNPWKIKKKRRIANIRAYE